MNNEVKCNGAGEMPGQEGNDSYDEDYSDWVDNNEDEILDAYKMQMELDDVPEEFMFDMYHNTKE